MNINLLCLITKCDNINKIKNILDHYKLPLNFTMEAYGTASASILKYFGLDEYKQSIYFSIIPDNMEFYLLKEIENELKFTKPGNGIGYTVPISSSSKYISDIVNKKEMEGVAMKNVIKKHLIVTIVQSGYASMVMESAKKKGANGGTILNGRGLESKNAVKFLGFSIEPEKDIVLIVIDDKIKKDVMEEITDKVGIRTKGKGICFSIPVSNTIGIGEEYE